MFATVAEHGSLVAEAFVAHVALERFLSRVLAKMIVEVDARFEGLVTRGTSKIANVLMVRADMRGQTARLAEGLAAKLASNLPANTMSSQVIAQRITISIGFRANVALGLLASMGGLVNACGRPVVKTGRTPIT